MCFLYVFLIALIKKHVLLTYLKDTLSFLYVSCRKFLFILYLLRMQQNIEDPLIILHLDGKHI
jgi:hypothetical protein